MKNLSLNPIIPDATNLASLGNSTGGNKLERDGDDWYMCYAGQQVTVAHRSGVSLITELVANPYKVFGATTLQINSGELRFPVDVGVFSDSAMDMSIVEISSYSGYDQVADDKAICHIQKEIAKLKSDCSAKRKAGKHLEADKLQNSLIVPLQKYLNQAVNRFGRPRRVGSLEARRTNTVGKSIKRAIAHIEKFFPEFADHLASSIRQNRGFAYFPPKPIEWEVMASHRSQFPPSGETRSLLHLKSAS